MSYDVRLSNKDYILTHSRAFKIHEGFNLLGAVEPDPALRRVFSNLTGLIAYESISDLGITKCNPDVVIIASPTETHRLVLDEILELFCPKVILCEKPLAATIADAKSMVSRCKFKNIKLYTNYIRRCDPGVKEIKRRILESEILGPFKGVVWYSKGMFNNGSHFADLMSFWFGPICEAKLLNIGVDLGDNDADVDFQLSFTDSSIIFCAADEKNFTHLTVEIIAKNGRLRYEKAGKIIWQGIEEDQTFDGYRRLVSEEEVVSSDMSRYQLHVVEDLWLSMHGDEKILCDGEDSLSTLSWLDRVFKNRTVEGM